MSTRSLSRRIGVAVGASVLAATTMAGPAVAAAGPAWPQPGHGPGRTFYNPDESKINAKTIDDVTYRWGLTLPENPGTCTFPDEPVVSGGRLFISDGYGFGVYAANTGKLLWRHTYPNPEDQSTPHLAVAGGLVLAGYSSCQSQSDPDGYLKAFDVATGKQRWAVRTDSPVESLVVDKGIAAVSGSSPSDPYAVHAFRASDGKKRWAKLNFWSSGVSAGGKLFVVATHKTLAAAVAITTGKTVWSRAKAWWVVAASPAGDRFFVYDGSRTLALKSSNGAIKWSAKGIGTWFATDGRRIFSPIVNGMQAFDATNGKLLWTRYFEGDTGQPVRAGGLLYTNVDAGEPIGIMHPATGEIASSGWQIGALDDDEHLVIANGWIYALIVDSLLAYSL